MATPTGLEMLPLIVGAVEDKREDEEGEDVVEAEVVE
jgi:HemY protein